MYCSYIPPNVVLQNWIVRVAVRRVKVKSMNEAVNVCPPSFAMSSGPTNTFRQTKLGARKPFKRHQSITHCDGHDVQLNQHVLCLKQRCSNSQCDEVYIWVLDMSTLTLIHTRETSQTADDIYSRRFTIADNAPARHSEHTRVMCVRARASRRGERPPGACMCTRKTISQSQTQHPLEFRKSTDMYARTCATHIFIVLT